MGSAKLRDDEMVHMESERQKIINPKKNNSDHIALLSP